MKEFIYKVNLSEINQRLDTYVASLDTVLSRSMAQRLIKEEKVTVNEKKEKESYKVKENDKVKIIIEEPKETNIKPEKIDLNIVYEDEYIIVINKEKGMVVHPR